MKALMTLDGSENSASIAPAARRLCELVPDIELHMLTVLDPKTVHDTASAPIGDPKGASAGTLVVRVPAPRVIESRGEAEERLHLDTTTRMASLAEREFPNVAATYHVEWSGNAAEAIVKKADELAVDVIVMATHGRSGLSHLLAGSVAEAVIRHSNRPVLVQCPKARN
jgi:nucleotide-binding universal stress UspA family protein